MHLTARLASSCSPIAKRVPLSSINQACQRLSCASHRTANPTAPVRVTTAKGAAFSTSMAGLASNSAAGSQQSPGDPMAIGTFPSFSTVNFYAGSRLSRLSWLRQSASFLNEALTNDQTRFILLNNLNPLVHATSGSSDEGKLATLTWSEIKDTVIESIGGEAAVRKDSNGQMILFGQRANGLVTEGQSESDEDKTTQGAGPTSLSLVFLGMDEAHLEQASLPGKVVQRSGEQEQSQDQEAQHKPAGIPFFALSLSFRPPGTHDDQVLPTERLANQLLESEKYDFVDTRALAHAGTWPLHDAAIVAQARSLVDWNERHQYCPACSRRQYSLWAGWKRACASALRQDHGSSSFARSLVFGRGPLHEEDEKRPCPTTQTLSNFCYPRTDPTVIMAVVSQDGEKILLGRNKKWPRGFYSCLAGFLEPGESLEEAVRREIYEESGVEVGNVVYHSSQPWPFPANLMIGAIGQAVEGRDTIRLDLDNELEEARFFSRDEVLNALDASSQRTLTRRELSRFDNSIKPPTSKEDDAKAMTSRWDQKDPGSVANVTERSTPEAVIPRPSFKLPGKTAIAHVLISAWARGHAHFPSPEQGDNGVVNTASVRGKM